MAPKIPKYARWPTAEELAHFSGMHCAQKYKQAVLSGWRCPSCHRSAQELVRWTEIRGPTWRSKYADEHGMGFTVVLTNHHCHGTGRFPTTLICGDCNSADGAVKRKLKLPGNWTFSPIEIGSFVKVSIHSGETKIDYAKAHEIYMRENPTRD